MDLELMLHVDALRAEGGLGVPFQIYRLLFLFFKLRNSILKCGNERKLRLIFV